MAQASPFIVVSGNIAAGKSTLLRRIAPVLGVPAYPERVEQNPFFAAPSADSFATEVWFLSDSAATHREIQRGARGGVQERSVFEHVPVFGRARARFGWLRQAELGMLERLAELLAEGLAAPDLLVYMEASAGAVAERIASRGRAEEEGLEIGYLALIGELYDELVDRWCLSPVYRLDTTRLDVREDGAFQLVSREITTRLP